VTGSRPVVTLSAAYGALGSLIGPRVAERLEVAFLDRAITAEVAQRMAVSLEEAEAHSGRSEHGLWRLLASFSSTPQLTAAGPAPAAVPDEREFMQETERVLHARARDGGVILGRAAALVLAEHPTALHVRLDGPVEARVAQVTRRAHIDDAEARERRRDADRAREAYVKHLYGHDPADPRLYHLVLDSTAIDPDTCVQLIVTAAHARQHGG
jgi:hypothetical protein